MLRDFPGPGSGEEWGRRGLKGSRKELNLLQTPLLHAHPLFDFIMPSGPIVLLSCGHVGPVNPYDSLR